MAIAQTLFPQTTLENAINKLGFIQVDPIRSPARAQDLMLRHRVKDYKVGDIDKKYPELGFEEDYLYAYGYLNRDLSALWYPNKIRGLTRYDKYVLEKIKEIGQVTSKQLIQYLGKKRVKNWWSGYSQAAKHSLDILNYWGLVRVVGRKKGIKVYEKRVHTKQKSSLVERKKQLIMTIVNILNPVTEKKLNEALHFIRYQLGEVKTAIMDLMNEERLFKQSIDGITYIILPQREIILEMDNKVRILTPFDPVIWDRRRFEHLWGWKYRFEAYTPKEKRIRGYYAMPILWAQNVIGWANVNKKGSDIDVELGFVDGRPKNRIFEKELDCEIESLKKWLRV